MLKRVHPPRPDWYEELYAAVLDKGLEAYEREVSGVLSVSISRPLFHATVCYLKRLQAISHTCFLI